VRLIEWENALEGGINYYEPRVKKTRKNIKYENKAEHEIVEYAGRLLLLRIVRSLLWVLTWLETWQQCSNFLCILDGGRGINAQSFFAKCPRGRTAAGAEVEARVRYTMEDDGLVLPWFGTVFVNPPYGRELPYWVAKTAWEVERGSAAVVLVLMPARTDTRYWHRYVAGRANSVSANRLYGFEQFNLQNLISFPGP
jgi:hypothetical protein